MSEEVDLFMAVTGCEDPSMAQNFLEMAQNNMDTAVSLYYEHGPSGGGNSTNNDLSNVGSGEDDEALAQRLQNEAYQDNTRAPDEARHERLVDDLNIFPGTFGGVGGSFNPLLNNPDQLIYGNQRRGIFNQRDSGYGNGADSDDSDIDSDEEFSGMTEGQKRLAKLFRPPFDIMEKLDLDSAKRKARQESKWILINIQDPSDFLCQTLNRDFWKSTTVKELVREHFVFLQYHSDSRSGEQYINFYPFKEYPHIAILDPITGERMKMWSGVPKVQKWCDEVYNFLNDFSLDPNSVNPIVQHKQHIDPNTLSEEKQMEYAIKQSLGDSASSDEDDSDLEMLSGGDEDNPLVIDDEQEGETESIITRPASEAKELTEEEKVKQIEPLNYEEPPQSPETTRIQIRTGDGSRIVKRFNIDDKVLKLYQVVKYEFKDKIGDGFFSLTSQRENLINKLDDTIADAGLKNASTLLEIMQDNE